MTTTEKNYWEIRAIVEVFAETAPVDWRGHLANGRYGKNHDDKSAVENFIFFFDPNPEQVKLVLAIKAGELLDHFVTITHLAIRECPCCGEQLSLETDGKIIRPTTDCDYPDGMVYEWELNVPSGKIVAANDLGELFSIEGDFNVNTDMGCRQTTLAMAEIGCAYAFVGNSCPGIYRVKGRNKFVVASGAPDLPDGEPIYYDGDRVASICTDLWWYSLADYDEFIRRGGEIDDQHVGLGGHDVIDVKPGVYRFQHFFHKIKSEPAKDDPYRNLREIRGVVTPYSEFEWVRKPDPVRCWRKKRRMKI